MAVHLVDAVVDPQMTDAAFVVAARPGIPLPVQGYVEFRNDKFSGQLWPRGGIPEGAVEAGQQPT